MANSSGKVRIWTWWEWGQKKVVNVRYVFANSVFGLIDLKMWTEQIVRLAIVNYRKNLLILLLKSIT